MSKIKNRKFLCQIYRGFFVFLDKTSYLFYNFDITQRSGYKRMYWLENIMSIYKRLQLSFGFFMRIITVYR